MKKIKTEYEKPLKIIENFIKQDEEGFKNPGNLLHLHGKFGAGKSVLVNSINSTDAILHDEFPIDRADINNLLASKNSKKYLSFEKKRYRMSKIFKILLTILNFYIAFVLAFLPFLIGETDIQIKLILLYPLSLPLAIFCWWVVLMFKIKKPKNKVIIIENIDRIAWEDAIYLLNKAYKNKKNKFIFTYSMENLSDRYFERFGTKTNLYVLLDKFIDVEINLDDYKQTYGQNILDKISNKIIKKYKFRPLISSMDNFRLVERSVNNIVSHKDDILIHKLNPEIIFLINYLKISDNLAYKYLSKNHHYVTKKIPSNEYKWFDSADYQLSLSFKEGENSPKVILHNMPSEFKFSKELVSKICSLGNSLQSNTENYSNFGSHFIDENMRSITKRVKETRKRNSSPSEYILALKKDNLVPESILKENLESNYSLLEDPLKLLCLNLYTSDKSLEESIVAITSIQFENLDIFQKMRLIRYIVTEKLKYFPAASKYTVSPSNYVSVSPFFKKFNEFKKVVEIDKTSKLSEIFDKLKKYLSSTIEILKKELNSINSKKWNELIGNYSMEKNNDRNWEIYEILLLTKNHPLSFDEHYESVRKAFENKSGNISSTLFQAFFGGIQENYDAAIKENLNLEVQRQFKDLPASELFTKEFIKNGEAWSNLYNDYRKCWSLK